MDKGRVRVIVMRFVLGILYCFFFQAEDGIRDRNVTRVQTCALPISSINARTMEQLTLETGLLRALDQNEFVLHYQPVVEFVTRRIVSVEALLHWQHPDRGLLAPDSFIPLVEGSDLIVSIGEWVIRTACEQLRTWQATGFPELRMTVNVAPRQLTKQDFIKRLVRILRETGIKPACLELELTERTLIQGMEWVVPQLQALRDLGI